MSVMGIRGIALMFPETFDVSPVKSHRPSSWSAASENCVWPGSRTPAKAHCVFHHENFR